MFPINSNFKKTKKNMKGGAVAGALVEPVAGDGPVAVNVAETGPEAGLSWRVRRSAAADIPAAMTLPRHRRGRGSPRLELRLSLRSSVSCGNSFILEAACDREERLSQRGLFPSVWIVGVPRWS